MSLASNGITQNVIREMMPPYYLSPDLLEAIFAALPPPPPDASAAWRQARITRLMQEISTLMPANAAQARLAAQILIVRELADTIAARAYAPELTVAEMCRVGRASADLVRTAAGVERLLARQQQKPAPFFGTVLADGVDVAAVDAAWGGGTAGAGALRQPGAGDADGLGERGDLTAVASVAGMAGSTPGTSAPPGQARWQALVGQGLPAMTRRESPAMTIGTGTVMTVKESGDSLGATIGQNIESPDAAEGEYGDSPAVTVERQAPAGPGKDADSPPGSVVTWLDQGPGWTLDVVRPRTGGEAALGAD